jgi:LysM repeat protein
MKRRVYVLVAALMLAMTLSRSATVYGQAGGCDRGPTLHASGALYGNTYVVVQGDTMFSVSRRFCLTVGQLAAVNGISNPWWIWPGQRLVISAGYWPPAPPPPPSPYPPPPKPPPPQPQPPPPTPSGPPYITIVEPVPYSVLPPAFTAHGWAGAVNGGVVVVRALDTAGGVLAEQTVSVVGPDAATDGEGQWGASLRVNVPADTSGTLTALSPGTAVAPVVIPVTFIGSLPPPPSPSPSQALYHVYAPGECQVVGVDAAPLYVFPGGPQAGQFAGTGSNPVTRAALFNDQAWYEITPDPGQPVAWAPETSIATVGAGCAWQP